MHIVVYFEMSLDFSLRTDRFCDLSMMSSVADIELLRTSFDVFHLLMDI